MQRLGSSGYALAIKMTRGFMPMNCIMLLASGSTGITVADNGNIDFGTGNFTLAWRGSLPDWTPSAAIRLISKQQDVNNRYLLYVNTSGSLGMLCGGNTFTSSINNTFVDGTIHHIVAVATVGASNTTMDFYAEGSIEDKYEALILLKEIGE